MVFRELILSKHNKRPLKSFCFTLTKVEKYYKCSLLHDKPIFEF